MVAASEINWASYKQYEGPFFRGVHRYKDPPHPTEDDMILGVTVATEGGGYDPINGYDGQICSSTLIQVIERSYYQVSAALGEVAKENRDLLGHFDRVLADKGLVFRANHRGRYRFFFRDNRAEVDTLEEQRQAFYYRATGEKGTWDDVSRKWAKEIAAAIATVWQREPAKTVQRRFVTPRLKQYAFGNSASVVRDAPKTPVGRAFVAAYLSFAVNNPTRANKHLSIAMKSYNGNKWTRDWLIHVLKELTLGPNINIYPHRYNAIRVPLERYYTLDLPDFADDLKWWQESNGYWKAYDAREIQEALLALGYDLGPWGADGKPGKKTRSALLSFEEAHAVPEPDGMPDPATVVKLEEVLEQRGIELLRAAA